MVRVSNGFDVDKMYSPQVRELEVKPFKDRIENAQAATKEISGKKSALIELEQLSDNLKKAITPFTIGVGGAFGQKKVGIVTNDRGNGADYANVTTDSTAIKGQFDIRVNRVATASNVTLTDNANNGFLPNQRMGDYVAGFNGGDAFDPANPPKIKITLDGVARSVSILNAADTIYNVRDYINSQLNASNIRTDVISNGNREFLSISSTLTGNKTLQVEYENNLSVFGPPIPQTNPTQLIVKLDDQGVDAEVVVGGVIVPSASNTIKDIVQGVTIELKKPNDAAALAKNLTINVTADGNSVANNFSKLIDAYNDLIEFSESQNKKTIVNGASVPAEDAYLVNSPALKQAMMLAKTITNLVPGAPASTRSLSDIGIGIAKAPDGSLKGTKLEVLDLTKLTYALENKLDDIKKLFQKNAAITNTTGTAANLTFIPQLSKVPSELSGTTIKINEDNAGNVTFTLPGGALQPAILNADVITFPVGSALEGVVFTYSGKVPGTAQDFDVTLSSGIGGKFTSQAEIFSKRLSIEKNAASKRSADLEKQEKIAQKAFDDKQNQIDNLVTKLQLMGESFDIEIENLNRLIDSMLGN